MTEVVYSIQLYSDRYTYAGEPGYCGCWCVPCPTDDPIRPRLVAACVGTFRDDDGTTGRAFFFADELAEQIDRAERASRCRAEAEPLRPAQLAAEREA